MSTSSDSSFEVVGDQDNSDKYENSRRLMASLQELTERLEMMERRRLEEDSGFSFVDLGEIESDGSDSNSDFSGETDLGRRPKARSDVQGPAAAPAQAIAPTSPAPASGNRANNKPSMKLVLCILLYTIGFILIGVGSKQIGFNRLMRAEELQGAKKIDVPFVSPGDLKFNEELQKIIKTAERTLQDHVAAIKKNKEKLIKIKCLKDIPKELMDQWVPDHSRFEGLEGFLSAKNLSGSVEEEFYTNALPVFTKPNANQMNLQFRSDALRMCENILMNGQCDYLSEGGWVRVSLMDGDLFVKGTYNVGNEYHRFTLVYYIPAEKLVLM